MTNTADKRSVATDALETLGTCPIPDNSGRDAIHLAVEPVRAATRLFPSQHVGMVNGKASGQAKEFVGIVDPFLTCPVEPDGMFWLVIYPRKITSLRHVWSHPAFDDAPARELTEREAAEQWLRDYAANIYEGFETLMQAADEWVDHGEYYYGPRLHGYHGKFEGESTHPDFWKHYEVYRGRTVPEDRRESFFTCSC